MKSAQLSDWDGVVRKVERITADLGEIASLLDSSNAFPLSLEAKLIHAEFCVFQAKLQGVRPVKNGVPDTAKV
jgi:hypothetical protein